MPVRLVCPSCSATLSVKDEYAGRAVKCPKCGGVIPASPPDAAAPPAAPPPPSTPAAALPPPAPPEPERPLFEELDGPAKAGGGSKIKGRPTGSKPGAKADAGDEDAPPRRKGRDDDRGDDPGARKRGRDADDADDGRPARGRRKGRDADDDSDGAGGKKKGGSNVAVILLVVFGGLFTCCGGIGYGVYYFVVKTAEKVKQGAEEFADSLKEKNDRVTSANYQKLKPLMTKTEVEAILGTGRPASYFTLTSAYEADNPYNKARIAEFDPKVTQGRVYVWRNKDDYLFIAFHDKPEAGGKLQLKAFVPKGGVLESSGISDDAEFAKANNLQMGGPAVEVSAENLAKEYKDNKTSADAKYKDKNVSVEGKLDAIDLLGDGTMYVRLTGIGSAGAGGVQPRFVVQKADMNKIFGCSRGQTITLSGKCVGLSGPFVDVTPAKFERAGTDPAVTVTAAALIAAYTGDEAAADAKYKEKELYITDARVESKTADAMFLVGVAKGAKAPLKIKVATTGDFRRHFETVKVGTLVRVRGAGGGAFDGTIYLNSAWMSP